MPRDAGGDHPNDAYLRMATSVLQFLWSDAVNQPHTDPTWAGRSSDPEPAPTLITDEANRPYQSWSAEAIIDDVARRIGPNFDGRVEDASESPPTLHWTDPGIQTVNEDGTVSVRASESGQQEQTDD